MIGDTNRNVKVQKEFKDLLTHRVRQRGLRKFEHSYSNEAQLIRWNQWVGVLELPYWGQHVVLELCAISCSC